MAKPKQFKFRTGLRTASKVQEKQLIANGKWLAEHPEAVIPKSDEDSRRCNFSGIESKIMAASESKADANVLRRAAKRGDQLVRAYAATILMAAEERAPYLAVAKGPEGDIAYAYSAKVKREPLIGIQYFKDPHLRLLAYAHLSRRRKVTFYSTKDLVYCSSQEGNTPPRFIEETAKRLNLSAKDKKTYFCGHDLDERGYLQIGLGPSGISLLVCESCFGSEKNIVARISERMLAPDIQRIFSVKAFVRLECRGECDDCLTGNMYEFSSDDKREYVAGKLSDKQVYEQAVERFLKSIEDSGKRLLVIGEKCFGKDVNAFAEALATTPLEKEAVQFVLGKLDCPVIVPDSTTTNKFLTQYWGRFGSELMAQIAGLSEEEETPQPSEKLTPMMLIEKARSHQRAETVKGAMPQYESLGKHAAFVDRIIRTYKSKGSEVALRLTSLSGTEDTHLKSIGLAFRIALGETGIEWQYTRVEIDLAKHLAAAARTLLEAQGDEYDILLRQFLRNAGVQDDVVRSK